MKKTLLPRLNGTTFLFFVILSLGLILRFRYITYIEHNVDHAYPIWQAMTTLDQGNFPLAGQGTSVLFANPPLTGYLYIPIVALTRSPLGVYIFVIALNWLAIWMTYQTVSNLLGKWTGLIAAFLITVNPWVIEYSRTSWVQSLLPFFTCLVVWLLWPVLTQQAKHPSRRLILALGAAALFTQTYLLAYFIVAPIAVLVLIFWKRIPKRALWISISIFMAVSALYGIGLAQQRDTVQTRIEAFLNGDDAEGESTLNFEAWDAAVRLITGSEYELARGVNAPMSDSQTRHKLSNVAHYILLIALLIGIGKASFSLFNGGKDSQRTIALILLIWFALPIISMSYTRNPVHPFYQILGFPAGFALAAWGIKTIFQPDRYRIFAIGLIAAAIPFGLLMSINSARYYQETAAFPADHDLFALPVGIGMEVGTLINEADAQVAFAEAEGWIINSFAGRLFPVVWDTRAPNFNYLPTDTGIYIDIGQNPAHPTGAIQEETIHLADGKQLIVDTLGTASTTELIGEALNVPSVEGLTLLTYQIEQEGDEVTVHTSWQVNTVSPDVPGLIFAPFIHVINADGDRVLIVDGEGIAGSAWFIGDIHLHHMTFSLPDDEGPFQLLLGQFDGLHGENIIFLPTDAEPTTVIALPELVSR